MQMFRFVEHSTPLTWSVEHLLVFCLEFQAPLVFTGSYERQVILKSLLLLAILSKQ